MVVFTPEPRTLPAFALKQTQSPSSSIQKLPYNLDHLASVSFTAAAH